MACRCHANEEKNAMGYKVIRIFMAYIFVGLNHLKCNALLALFFIALNVFQS